MSETSPTQQTPEAVRPGALIAVLAGGLAMDFAADLNALQDQHPDTVLVVSNGSGVFEIRAAGTPCGCHTCAAEDQQVRTDSGLMSWWSGLNGHMILCPDCGNKRCPRATNHVLDCTGSNSVGQPGSIYEGAPRPAGD